MFGILGALVTGGIGLAKEYISSNKEKKRLELQNEQERVKNQGIVEKAAAEAKAKAMVTRMDGDIAWETTMAKGSLDSWKDEYMTIFATSPYWVAMMPAVIGAGSAIIHWDPSLATTGLNSSITAIKSFPEPLHYGAAITYGAAYGIRGVKDFFQFKKGI